MKISKRLQQLDEMIVGNYQNIWDCCCDHGLLGFNLLQRKAAGKIHFVDIVETLTSALTIKLKHFFSGEEFNNCWQVHNIDAGKISLSTETIENNDLVIIAGVGGDRVIEIVNQIIDRYPQRTIEFLLSPIHHNYKVRQALIKNNMGLINEKLINENNRFYELMHVSTNSATPISSIGSILWDFSQPETAIYLDKTIAHYQRQAQDPKKNVKQILEAYNKLKNSHIDCL